MNRNGKRPTGKGSRTRPVTLVYPVLAPIAAEQERRAIGSPAELLAPLFLEEGEESGGREIGDYHISIRPDGLTR